MDSSLVGNRDWRDELAGKNVRQPTMFHDVLIPGENVRQTTMSHDVLIPWIRT